MKATKRLHNLGKSLWLGNITRDLLNTSTLKSYIDELSKARCRTGRRWPLNLRSKGPKPSKSWNELLAVIASKSNALKKGEFHAISAK